MTDKYIDFEFEDKVYVYRLAGFWERFAARVIDFPFYLISISIAFIFGPWLSTALMQSSHREGTIGQMAMGIQIVDEYGDRIDFAKASARYWSRIFNFMTLGVGIIVMLFNGKGQTLPDMICKTVVIKEDPVEVLSCDEYYQEGPLVLMEPVYREREVV